MSAAAVAPTQPLTLRAPDRLKAVATQTIEETAAIRVQEKRCSNSLRGVRIMFVASGLSLGGAEVMLSHLVAGLRDRGAAVGVVSLTAAGPLAGKLLAQRIPVWCLDMPRGRPRLWGILRAAFLVKRFRPDILQGWLYHGNLAATLVKYLSGRRSDLTWSLHSLMSQEKQSRNLVNRCCALLSHVSPRKVICVSQRGIAVHAGAGYDVGRFVYIPNGIDTDRFHNSSGMRQSVREELGIAEDDLVVGHLGRFDPAKDYDCLLKAARLVIRDVPRSRFVLCGTGLSETNEQLQQLIDTPQTHRRCLFLGPRSDPECVLNAFDVFLLSSRSEAFPLALLEAMSTGLPCIATDVGDCKAILGEVGRIVPSGDSKGLADACIQSLLQSPAQRAQEGAAARARVIRNFSLERCVEAHAGLYEGLLAARDSALSTANQGAFESRC